MTQSEVDVLVSRATGEAIDRVQRLGFSLADRVENFFDPEPFIRPKIVDWDQLDRERLTLFP